MSPTKILVIDEDKKLISRARKIGKTASMDIQVCHLGAEGIQAAEANAPDLIVLCGELADMNGYMVCKKIRDNPVTQKIPVIFTSAKAKQEDFDKHRKLKARADSYLMKPVTREVLKKSIAEVLSIEPGVLDGEEGDYTDLSEIFDFEDEAGVPKVTPLDQATASGSSASNLEEEMASKERELDYLRKEVAAFKPFMAQMKQMEKDAESSQAEIARLKSENERLATETEAGRGAAASSENHQAEVADLQEQFGQQINELTETIQRLELERDQAASSGADVDEALSAKTAQIEQLQSAIKAAEEKAQEQDNIVSRRQEALHEEINELEQALEHSKNNNLTLESRMMEAEQQVGGLQEQIDELRQLNETLERKLGQAQEEASSYQSQGEEQAERLRDDLSNEFKHREQELLQKVEQLESEREQHDAALAESVEKAQALEEEIKQKQLALDAAFETLESTKRELAEQAQADLEKKESEWRLEADGLRGEIEHEREEWDAQRAQHEAAMGQAQEKIGVLEAAVKELKTSHQEELAELKERHEDELERYLQTVTAQKGDLRQQLDTAIEKVNQLESIQSTHKKEIEQLGSTQRSLESELKESHAKNQSNQELLDQAHKEKEELTQQVEQLLEAVGKAERLESELAVASSAAEELQGLLTTSTDKLEELTQERDQLEEARASHVSEIEALRTGLMRSEQLQSELQEEVMRLRLGHDTLRSRLDRASEALETGLRELKGTTEELTFEE